MAADREAYVFNFSWTASPNFIATTDSIDLMDGAWHHFTGTFDANHFEFNVDGVLQRTADFPSGVLRLSFLTQKPGSTALQFSPCIPAAGKLRIPAKVRGER
ncbi:MAG: LamG domain-containing protein [Fibrobacterota bacterium]|nr:LamG domain-containing protein [Fibrobacterota bacterium]